MSLLYCDFFIMKVQVFLLCLVAAVSARPEAGILNTSPPYQPPSGGYLPGHTSVPTFPTAGIYPGGNYNHNGPYQQDQKNVYFFAAPDEEEVSRLRIYVQPSSGRNTKVIFIKAPGQGRIIPDIIAPPSEAVDRTLVYVLSKHQKNGGSVTIPANLGIKQAKPEVYFVKYRNQHDAQSAVQQGLNGQRVGTGLDDLGSAQVFTSNLGGRAGFGNDGYHSGILPQDGVIGTNYGPPSGSGPY